jgi:TonB dependent receptor/Carboxypeptidase regulatory-like domain/TonB-dependent Receptor Plug Domain
MTFLKTRLTNISNLFFLLFFLPVSIVAQTGTIKGKVTNSINNTPVSFATIIVIGTDKGATTDDIGNYEITGLVPKLYSIKATNIGFKEQTIFEIQVTNSQPTNLDFKLEETKSELAQVVVKASPFRKTEESPVSLRTIGVSEIKRNPGGNQDISKVIQSLPGVTSNVSFRNDLIIRGGAPNENRFYLDEVEIPNINHFSTQGSSGGPVGILNVNFIKEVDFYSGAFPANRGNAISSVFNFKQKDGDADKWRYATTISATDIRQVFDGPLSKNTTMMLSIRRSYLAVLFKALKLPFLPTYNDFNLKIKNKIDDKNELTFIGVGSVDKFDIDTTANKTELQRYQLGRLPDENPQWSYTNGLVYKHFDKDGYYTFVASRNMLDNQARKWYGDNPANPFIYDYKSQEIENKLRAERTQRFGDYKLIAGLGYEFVKYNNSTNQKIFAPSGPITKLYQSAFSTSKYYAFAQLSRKFLDDKLIVSGGVRVDGSSYNSKMNNPLDQFSPRFSLAYAITPEFAFNLNAGRFFQLPAYTTLGYQENGKVVNQDNLTFIKADHLVAGFEYNTKTDSKFSIEGYYKKYSNYPFSIRNGVCLANLGADFGVIGDEAVTSSSEGRTYGLEFLFQQRLYKGFYGIAAFTYGRSEFQDQTGNFAPSAWDSKQIVALTLGKQFGKDWEIGIKWRYQSGLPYTPSQETSTLVSNWNAIGRGVPDFSQVNSLRLNATSIIDFRIDKKWYGKKATWDLYLDIQNIFSGQIVQSVLFLDKPLDASGNPIGEAPIFTNSKGLQQYQSKLIELKSGNSTPNIGLTVEF